MTQVSGIACRRASYGIQNPRAATHRMACRVGALL